MAEQPPIIVGAAAPEPEGESPQAQSAGFSMSRRDFLIGLGAGAAGVVGLDLGGVAAVKAYRRHEGRNDTKALFGRGLYSWHKLGIFPSLLQIDPSVTVASDIFAKPASQPDWPDGEFVLALRPIGVKETLLRNIADQSPGIQDSVDRVLDEISPQLLAFYQPGPGKLVYCDAEANKGLMVPMSNEYLTETHLPVTDVDIDGREVRGEVVYPYTLIEGVGRIPLTQQDRRLDASKTRKQQEADKLKALDNLKNYYPNDTYQIIGQCVTAASINQLNAMVSEFLNGSGPRSEPIPFPNP